MEEIVGLLGYSPSDGSCLPCSGVSGRAVSVSSRSFCSEYKVVKVASLKSTFRGTSCVCNASSSGHRRNPDFSRQNKRGFSRNRNRQNEERDGSENLEESELFSSKNGPLLSLSSSPKFQATSTPGPREKEIVELFRKVQAQLRERAATKEKKKDDLQKRGKESETVDSLLKLLRKHSVQQGKKSNSSRSSRDFISDQARPNGPLNGKKSTSFFDSTNTKKDEDQEHESPSFSRPVSKFQRKSPVPQVKLQPLDSDENTVNSVPYTNLDGKREKTHPDPGIEHVAKLEVELEPETSFFDGDEISEDEIIDSGEVFNDDDADENAPTEFGDLSVMKLTELRALAKSRGMKGFSKLKKRELLELLTVGSSST
ncbi:rho-N domain-containing protein 1, chloroplastic-like isoform X2 [Cornus florida]|uniref:rho-N domain-containing protein 1, chloroplastic-like isoform X2 n=1 Tax=Cornus florida TaxID=4283 RepID=UPI00289DC786|nr:rho-N domain-containing protein 1, chloroplastic-like isoform X2 [Cornus florida]